jgi:hypothetical protein
MYRTALNMVRRPSHPFRCRSRDESGSRWSAKPCAVPQNVGQLAVEARRPASFPSEPNGATSFGCLAHLPSGGSNAPVWGGDRLSRGRRPAFGSSQSVVRTRHRLA